MTENTLDSLLQNWTAQHSLPTVRAEAIRATILRTPQVTTTALPARWWGDFSVTLTANLQQSITISPDTWRFLSYSAR